MCFYTTAGQQYALPGGAVSISARLSNNVSIGLFVLYVAGGQYSFFVCRRFRLFPVCLFVYEGVGQYNLCFSVNLRFSMHMVIALQVCKTFQPRMATILYFYNTLSTAW